MQKKTGVRSNRDRETERARERDNEREEKEEKCVFDFLFAIRQRPMTNHIN